MFVCLCRSVTESDIRQAVTNGAHDFAQLQQQTGCSTECGCCMEFADQVMFESLAEQGKLLRMVACAN